MRKSILGILLLLSQYGFSQNSYPGTGGMTFATGTWHFSDDGYKRFCFLHSGKSYFGSGNGYEFRSSADQPIFTIDNTGNVIVRDQLWAQNNLYVYNSTARPAITLKNDVGETPNPQGGGLVAGSAYGGGILFGNHGANTGYQNRYLQLGMVDNGYQFTPAISIPSETLNVGIGTTNPAAKLDVQSSSGPSQDNIAMFRNSFNNSYSAFSAVGSSPTVGTWTSGSQIMELVPYGTGKGIVSSYTGNLVFQTNGRNDRMTIANDGNVGIGTTTPSSKLYIAETGAGTLVWPITVNNLDNNSNSPSGTGAGIKFKMSVDGEPDKWAGIAGISESAWSNEVGLAFYTGTVGQQARVRISNNGNVIIGTPASINNAYQLNVGGIVRANKVVVNTTGADFVFDSTYKLPSLETVADFIKANKHLPQIASAEEMQKNGLDVGEQQTKLLQKIEELTLYAIEQDKKMKLLEEKLNKLLGEKR